MGFLLCIYISKEKRNVPIYQPIIPIPQYRDTDEPYMEVGAQIVSSDYIRKAELVCTQSDSERTT